jgi:uncharacterized membrane protein
MRQIDFGRILFGLGIAGLGVLSLVFGKFALQWQPVPSWLPQGLGYANGGILLAGGIGLFLVRRVAVVSALVLLAYLALWVVIQAVNDIAHLLDVGANLGLFEDLALMCGAWIAYATLADDGIAFLKGASGLMAARILFGVACLIFGLSHFLYADFTAQMVPAFLPFHLPLAYITGAGHVAAGLALISGILSRLAATCEAAMMSLFLVLVHIPMVLTPIPTGMSQLFWTMLCVAGALSGSAWLLVSSLNDRPWGLAHRRRLG